MLLPDSGEVIIDGVDVVNFPEKARQIVSFCQQKSLFFPDLTVWEHLAFYATVVILDEPSSSLDPDSRRELWDVLLEMRRRTTTILLSTHDMHEADLLADRVILLCRGMVASTGTPTFLKNRFSGGHHPEMRLLHRGTKFMEGGVQRSHTVSRLAALWAKRWLCFTRSPCTVLICWLLPVAVFVVQFRLEQDLLTKRNSLTARLDLVSREVDTELIAIIPKELFPQGAAFVQVDNVSVDFFQKYFNPWLQGTVHNIVSVASAKQMLLAIGFGNFLEYTRAFVFGSVFGHDELEAWWNPHAVLSSVISLNAMHTALLRHLSGDITSSIVMNVRLYKEEESTMGPLMDFSKAAKRDALSVVLPMFVRAVFIPLGAALCIAPMALQPSSERVGGVLTFQLMAGVSPLLFWAANLAFDLCVYALAWSFVGGSAPIFVYLVVTTLDLTRGIQAPRWVPLSLCPLPAFAFPWALLKLMQLNAENAQCKRYAQTKHLELYQLDVFCLALTSSNRFPGAMHFCCEHYTNNATVGVQTLNPFSFHSAGVALEILVMAAEGVLLFALVVWRDWQSAIGYCSQTDGLLDSLTAKEYLRLIARLRGVPEGDISSLVDDLLFTFRLSGHAKRKCGTYSGGNRRKLSVAAALIGQPRVVFLDEPSAGVDVLARRDIVAALRAISGTCGTAVVMTSHKMDECEAACDRVGIMADGKFRCLGSLRHLVQRYGRGCTVAFTLQEEPDSPTRVASIVNEILPQSKRLRAYKGRHEYQLDKALSWGTIFAKVEELKVALHLDDVCLTPASLEDVFTELAVLGTASN
ncbi:hypothetical protein MRX96_047032 [Rhipicephalus microplus]